MTTVSFDFDDTLAEETSTGILISIPKYVELLKEYHALGCKCIILTARNPKPQHLNEIKAFTRQHGIEHCVLDIVFTGHELKGPFAFQHGVNLHYDDKIEHIRSIEEYGIQCVLALS